MRKILLASVAAAALSAGTAFAADLPARGPAAAPAPVFVAAHNWTGVYVGLVAGYGWSSTQHCDGGNVPPCQPGNFPSYNVKGGTIGGTIGYNLQFGNMVLGVEADYSWANIKGSVNDAAFGFNCGASSICYTEINGIGTARLRAGYAFGRFLPYITGGIGFANYDVGHRAPSVANDSGFRTSAVLGAGLEVAINHNWSLKAEYLHLFSKGRFNYDPQQACGAPGCFSRHKDLGWARVGLNYRFGGSAAPVVAKY